MWFELDIKEQLKLLVDEILRINSLTSFPTDPQEIKKMVEFIKMINEIKNELFLQLDDFKYIPANWFFTYEALTSVLNHIMGIMISDFINTNENQKNILFNEILIISKQTHNLIPKNIEFLNKTLEDLAKKTSKE